MRTAKLALLTTTSLLAFWFCANKFLLRPSIQELHKSKHLHAPPSLQVNGNVKLRAQVKSPGGKEAQAIREAFRYAWNGYSQKAFGHDEVRPVSGLPGDTRNGFGATIVDAMSTAMLMGLDDIVDEQIAHCLKIDWTLGIGQVNTFETTIRYLGGLLSAIDLITEGYTHLDISVAQGLLDTAKALADLMAPMFDTPTGIAALHMQLGVPIPVGPSAGSSSIATAGTLILEWTRLSDLLNDQKYANLARKAYTHFLNPKPESADVWPGLVPTWISTSDGMFQAPYNGGWGGESDSYYEYLIKLPIYNRAMESEALGAAWINAVNSTMTHLASRPAGAGNTYANVTLVGTFQGLTRENGGTRAAVQNRSGHLDCFIGGNIILGAMMGPRNVPREFLDFGLRVTDGCHYAAEATKLGITPENFGWEAAPEAETRVQKREEDGKMEKKEEEEIDDGHEKLGTRRRHDRETTTLTTTSTAAASSPDTITVVDDSPRIQVLNGHWALRPEVAESYFYAYRATHDPKYRTWAWHIFGVLERHCKAAHGYASLASVDVAPEHVTQVDSQESFLFAETLKYLFLIFADEAVLDLEKFVFNTEGHPLRIQTHRPVVR